MKGRGGSRNSYQNTLKKGKSGGAKGGGGTKTVAARLPLQEKKAKWIDEEQANYQTTAWTGT